MPNTINFYMDDSGTRHPDKAGDRLDGKADFFALGGVLIREEDEASAREMHAQFCEKWGISYPLHSSEIRHRAHNFAWLGALEKAEHERFLSDLEAFLLALPVLGIACVIDRPGYNARYRTIYGRDRWSLCKTAFSVSVERAAKHAGAAGCRLRVLPERCSKKEDAKLRAYYDELKREGSPFDPERSAGYRPLGQEDYARLLYEFRTKAKSSPLAQVADMYLWPICKGGYNREYYPFRRLVEAGRLVDAVCDPARRHELGTKYSCFQKPETTKAQAFA